MTVQEYNKGPYRQTTHAENFIKNLHHAMQKCGAYEEAMRQLSCIGWCEEVEHTICTALHHFRKSCLKQVRLQQHFSLEELNGTFSVSEVILSENLTADEACQLLQLLRKARTY